MSEQKRRIKAARRTIVILILPNAMRRILTNDPVKRAHVEERIKRLLPVVS